MWRTASARLLTEPLYTLILIWVIIAFLQYLRERLDPDYAWITFRRTRLPDAT